MEYNIYDLMEGIADDDTITLSPSGTADLRRIEELTMNKIKEQNEGRRVKKPVRRVTRMVLVAAIAAALCAVTVVAVAGNATGKVTPADTAKAGEMDDKSTAAFSDGISTQQADIRDANGNTIQLPEMERVPTDPETAQRLVGGYLMTLDNATVTIENNYYGDYTITLETMLIDEKGAGMITYYVENPKGVAYRTKGLSYGAAEHTQMPMVGVTTPEMVDASGRWVSHESYLDEENTTDTHVQAVLYFSVCGDYKKGETIYVSFNWGGGAVPKVIAITPTSYVPVRTFTEKGGTHTVVSPLGIRVDTGDLPNDETQDITIRYKDGTEFVVKGSGVDNSVTGAIGPSIDRDNVPYYQYTLGNFNRLVDVDQIASIEILHHYYDVVGQGDEKSVTRVYEP